MIRAKHLKFLRAENPPETLHCNHCNRMAKSGETSWRIADIPIHEGRDTASVVVCSKNCQRALVQHPKADDYVNDLVERCEQMSPPGITQGEVDKFADILQGALASMGLKAKLVVNQR